jgi:hypothetical protein
VERAGLFTGTRGKQIAAGRHEQARTGRAERPARPHHPVSYRDER